MKFKNKLIILMVFLVYSFAIGQNETKTQNFDWKLISSDSSVKIYKKSVPKDDIKNGIFMEYNILKFVNLTNDNIEVSWIYDLYYDDIKLEMSDGTYDDLNASILLTPNQTYVSSVSKEKDKNKTVFIRLTDFESNVLTDMQIKSLVVTKLN